MPGKSEQQSSPEGGGELDYDDNPGGASSHSLKLTDSEDNQQQGGEETHIHHHYHNTYNFFNSSDINSGGNGGSGGSSGSGLDDNNGGSSGESGSSNSGSGFNGGNNGGSSGGPGSSNSGSGFNGGNNGGSSGGFGSNSGSGFNGGNSGGSSGGSGDDYAPYGSLSGDDSGVIVIDDTTGPTRGGEQPVPSDEPYDGYDGVHQCIEDVLQKNNVAYSPEYVDAMAGINGLGYTDEMVSGYCQDPVNAQVFEKCLDMSCPGGAPAPWYPFNPQPCPDDYPGPQPFVPDPTPSKDHVGGSAGGNQGFDLVLTPYNQFTLPDGSVYLVQDNLIDFYNQNKESIFDPVEARWENIIQGHRFINGKVTFQVGVRGDNIGVSAHCGASGFYNQAPVPYGGHMTVGWDALRHSDLHDILTHEVGHAVWPWYNGRSYSGQNYVHYDHGQAYFTGPKALAVYSRWTGKAQSRIPVEAGHWSNALFQPELMSPYINPGPSPISELTLAALEDEGWIVNHQAAERFHFRQGWTHNKPSSDSLIEKDGLFQDVNVSFQDSHGNVITLSKEDFDKRFGGLKTARKKYGGLH
ncbi:hypothetical protein EIL50_05275 [bacterium NHP-B]|nr:hypothetical protein EIL50_05275 [bacterium NHP-B]